MSSQKSRSQGAHGGVHQHELSPFGVGTRARAPQTRPPEAQGAARRKGRCHALQKQRLPAVKRKEKAPAPGVKGQGPGESYPGDVRRLGLSEDGGGSGNRTHDGEVMSLAPYHLAIPLPQPLPPRAGGVNARVRGRIGWGTPPGYGHPSRELASGQSACGGAVLERSPTVGVCPHQANVPRLVPGPAPGRTREVFGGHARLEVRAAAAPAPARGQVI